MTLDLKKSCEKELKSLTKNITGADKVEALSVCGISRPTLDKYLTGNIANIDKALEIIAFFRGKVQHRLDRLQGAA